MTQRLILKSAEQLSTLRRTGALISKSLKIHLGENYAMIFGEPYQSLIHGGLMLLIYWLLLRWMFNKKLFIRI
jgi:hypothetical protein